MERAREPDRGRVRGRRPRVRGREARARAPVRLARRPDADGLRRPVERRARLLGPRPARARARPRLHERAAVRLRPLHVQQGPVQPGVPALGRHLPDAAGRDRRRVRGLRPAVAARRVGRRDAADHRLVPAVPEPFRRRPRLRAGPRAVRVGRRRRVVQLRRLRAGRRSGEPVRRPAGRHADPADRGGRGAAQPGRPHGGRPDGRRRDDPARRPGHRRGAARQPGRGQRGRDDAADRRARLPQPVPAHDPARGRARSGPATSAGTSGRRSTGSPRRPRPSATTAGRATRAAGGCRPTTT